jgi:YD repeat-containing protein
MTSLAQGLPKIVPLSPNAASIAKYGEIPVGHFTGVPNIGIPLYTVNSGDLSLPLSLSYHAGGNKVESIASWVGLGWSLGSIPSISRSVRGLPDENGFYTKYNGQYSVAQIAGHTENPPTFSQNFLDTYASALFNGFKDSEPDIFNYSIPEESGKFFWDQETQKFITYPKSNIKIIRDGLNFTLISQEGVEYTFNRHDQTKTDTSAPGSFVTNSWYATKMVSATKKDSIRFAYKQENQSTKTVGVTIKYHYLGGVTGNGYPTADGSILGNTLTYAMLPDSIISSNGYIKFNKNTNEREDLKNGHSLDNISIYDNQNKLITKYKFSYHYKTGNGPSGGTLCSSMDSYTKKWMLLDKLEQMSNDINSGEKLAHTFLYNETYFPACRISAAQDYWGYYNGQNNQNLIPSYYVHGTNNLVSGANREINTSKSDYGILEKIIYPTGGYTEFEYENNESLNPSLPNQTIKVDQGLYGDDYHDVNGNMPPNLRDFESPQFTINNPNSGSQIEFTIQLPGCDISNGSNNCALFTMTNVATNDKWFPHLDGTISYAPNGTYKLSASFDTSNNNYQDFIFIVEWDEVLPGQSGNKYVGGIRVKETRSYTSSGVQPLVKKYKYTSSLNTTESSGDIFSIPNFSHSNVISYYNNPAQGGVSYTSLQKISSISNLQQVSHSGSFIGYKKVFEETSDINETGYTEYEFSHVADDGGGSFPYPPSFSKEIDRGLLLKESHYKKTPTGFTVVKEKSLEYTSDAFDLNTSPKTSSGFKWENNVIGCGQCNIAQNLVPYFVAGGWKQLSKETIINYFDNGNQSSSTSYYYDNASHLLSTGTKTTSSDAKSIISKIKYPQDISNPTSSEQAMVVQNRIGEVVETQTYKDLNENGVTDATELLSTQKTNYKTWFPNIIMAEFVKTSKGSATPESRVEFNSYYDNGKVKEVSMVDGVHIVYVWGYNQEHPIAKIENSTYSQISSFVSNLQNLSNADNDRTLNYSGNEGALRQALDNLRYQSSLSGAMITTYTYDPLIGVTSITDPRGYTMYYEYDNFNRLKSVHDQDGNILSANEYNYKPQN